MSSIEPVPIEQLPLDLPPEIRLANQLVWHGMQVFFNDTHAAYVQPELAFADVDNEHAPIGVTIHPDHTFERQKGKPWGYQTDRPMFTLGKFPLRATEITVATIEYDAPGAPVSKILPLIPEVILDLNVHAALSLGRPDLDDSERHYLERTQYFLRKDKPAKRQDVFDVAGETHRVVHQPPNAELERLHGEVYLSYASCACGICVPLDYYGPLQCMPPERFARFGNKRQTQQA